MPVLKISLTDDDYKILTELALTEKISIQDYMRYRLLSKRNPIIFVPEEAARRALEKFSKEDEAFSLPDIYGDSWSELDSRMTGIFGKRFFNFIKDIPEIEFAGMTADGRRATYRIV